MNPNTLHLKELEPNAELPSGFLMLPDALQEKAAELVEWAKNNRNARAPESTAKTRAVRKRERQNKRRGRNATR